MSYTEECNNLIQQIIGQLYPDIAGRLNHLLLTKTQFSDGGLEIVSDILDELHNEFISLSKYETRLLFPTILKVSNDQCESVDSCNHATEILSLIRKKEDRIRDLVLSLETEAELLKLNNEDISGIINIFSHNFINTKHDLHKCIMQLQRNRSIDINEQLQERN